MKKIISVCSLLMIGLLVLVGCGKQDEAQPKSDETEKVAVVTTNSILSDMVQNVGGDLVEVHSIVPVGVDPHEYEPLPEDMKKASDADIIFYNGLNLETGGNGWFNKLMTTANRTENEDFFAVSTEVTPFYLTSAGKETEQDPHAWLDIENGIKYSKRIAEVLIQKDADHADIYQKNLDKYVTKLTELHETALSKFADIPADQKLLVTSEGAFKYFSQAYGLTAGYIWEINTEDQGTPEQMKQIIKLISEYNVPNLFVETSVDSRSMEKLSAETGIEIYGTLFTDSLAKSGEVGDTYYSMMEWNLNQIHDGLTQK